MKNYYLHGFHVAFLGEVEFNQNGFLKTGSASYEKLQFARLYVTEKLNLMFYFDA